MKYLLLLLPCLFIRSDNYTIKLANLSDYGRMIVAPKRFNNGIVYSMIPLKYYNNNQFEACLFFSEIMDKEELGKPQRLTLKPLLRFKKGAGSFDYCPATGEVFFSAINTDIAYEEDANNLAIYTGTMDGLTIKNIEILSFCDPTYNIGHSTISSDGKTLIFYYGKKDGNINLYQSTRSNLTDAWSTPSAIHELKSNRNDLFPKLLNDSLLVFSSNRPEGNGGLDLYFTQKKDGHWSSPMNWEAINTDKDETSVEMIDETSGYITANWDKSPMPMPDQLYYFQMDKAPWKE